MLKAARGSDPPGSHIEDEACDKSVALAHTQHAHISRWRPRWVCDAHAVGMEVVWRCAALLCTGASAHSSRAILQQVRRCRIVEDATPVFDEKEAGREMPEERDVARVTEREHALHDRAEQEGTHPRVNRGTASTAVRPLATRPDRDETQRVKETIGMRMGNE